MEKKVASQGFTLIELVLLIVVLSLAGTSLVQVFGQVTGGLNGNNDVQVASQLTQECSEYLLGRRRNTGYAMGGVNDCTSIPLFNGSGPATVVLTEPYSGAACPTSATCKLFQITASYQSATTNTQIMMVSY